MKKLILTLCLILCSCGEYSYPQYELTLLDGTKVTTTGYCIFRNSTYIEVSCSKDGVIWYPSDIDTVYIAKELNVVGE